MDDKGAPAIKKYTDFSGQEGYGYIVIRNDEEGATYREHVTFNKFTGLTMLKPESGTSYEIEVKPKSSKTIIV